MNDKEFLQWVYDRLINAYHVNPNLDWVRRLKSIVESLTDEDIGEGV